MVSNVRSVTVRMNADVAQYIADVRRAGRETQASFSEATAAATATERGMGGVTSASGRVVQSTRQVASANDQATRSLRTTANQLVANTREGERMRRGLDTLGKGAGVVGAAAAAGLFAITAVTAKFDSAMSRVSAATNASASDLEELRNAAIQAGADTVFSATEAADGITELGKAGLSTTDILDGGLTGALNLAAAGQIGVADAANTTATTLQQFGLQGDQASRVADVLAASANKAMGDVTDMSEALKYVGPVAAQMGLGLEDTAGAIAELAQQGILGSQAGTSLRGMLTSLTSPSKQASLTMEGLGINMYDAQGKFIGLDGIAGQLHDTMGGLTNAERDQALGRIFGNEQITAARILYAGGSDDVEKWTAAVTDSGFAADQAATLTDNLSGDLEQFKGSLETALIGAGEGGQGPLRGLVQKGTEAVNVFNDLPGPIKSVSSGLLAITAITGGAAFFGSKVIGGIAATNVALADLGVTARVTGASLATTGASLGAIAVISAGYASDGLSVVDTFNRSRDAGKSYGATLDEITANLSASNVGKYAQDLGIDINRLSADLAQNGENGAYVTQVMNQLSESGHGVGAMFSGYLGGVLPFYTAKADKASASSRDLRDVIDGMGTSGAQASDLIGLLGVKLDANQAAALNAAGATDTLATSAAAAGTQAYQTAEEVAQSAKEMADAQKAAQSAAEGFFNLGDSLNDSKVSLGDWIGSLEKQADALRNFRRNAIQAADQGLRKGLIAALQDAGPEGALRLGQLADASQAEITRANKAWKRGQGEIKAYTAEVTGVPTSVATNVTANTGQANAAIEQTVQRLARINGFTATTYIKTVRQAAGGGKGADAVTAGPLGGSFASGGYTGRGGKYEVAGVVHRGEVVIPQDRVARDWSSLKARYGDLPGFAGGGVVGSNDDTSDDAPDKASTSKGSSKSEAAARVRKAKARAKANRQANNAVQNFEIDLTIDDSGVSSAADSFKDEYGTIKDRFKDANRKLSDALVEQTKKIRAQSVAYDGLTKTLQATKDKQAALSGAASGSVNNDIFGNGLAGLQAQLGADTSDLGSIQAALSQAVANGLDGGLFEALAGSGDVTTISQVGQLDAAGIQALEDSFNNRVTAQNALGTFAGDTAYGAAISQQSADIKAMKNSIERMENRLPGAVERGAEAGSERGSRKGSTDGTAAGSNTANLVVTQGTRAGSRGGGHRRGKGK